MVPTSINESKPADEIPQKRLRIPSILIDLLEHPPDDRVLMGIDEGLHKVARVIDLYLWPYARRQVGCRSGS